jgi:hypothetical protein
MRLLFILLALFTLAHASDTMTEVQGADELQKELNSLNKQAEETLQQVDALSQLHAQLPGLPIEETKARVMRLASDSNFLRAGEELWKSKQRKHLMMIQAAFFVFMLLFKGWRQSRAQHWFKKTLVGLVCSLITWAGLSYVIPLIVLGKPFAVFTSTLWRVVVMGR